MKIFDHSPLSWHNALRLPPVSPTAIVVTDEDVYWASALGIHSLLITTQYGGHPVTCISLPISRWLSSVLAAEADEASIRAEWDQERHKVSWEIGKYLVVYDYRESDKLPGAEQVWRVEQSQIV